MTDAITRAEVDWSTERESKPINADDAKYILEKLSSDLIDIMSKENEVLERDQYNSLNTCISKLKKLKEHRFYLDGGKPYDSFWASGDKLFDELRTLTGEVQYKESPERQEALNEKKNQNPKIIS